MGRRAPASVQKKGFSAFKLRWRFLIQREWKWAGVPKRSSACRIADNTLPLHGRLQKAPYEIPDNNADNEL